MMKYLLFLFPLLVMGCDRDDPIIVKDFCPACTASIEINGEGWGSKPHHAWFQNLSAQDSVFDLEIWEKFPKNDPYPDNLYFSRIPFEVGVYPLDASNEALWNTSLNFAVFQCCNDAPEDHYEPVYDGSSVITIDSIDKSTGALVMSFDLVLYANGNLNGESHNITYPNVLEITGQVQVIVTKEE